jgi:hypothetical protein
VRAKLDLTLETIDEFMTHMRPAANADAADVVAQVSDLVDRVFDVIFDRRVAPIFAASADSEIALLPTEVRVRRGFLRWCIGQMGVYARFRSVPDCEAHMQRFIAAVVADEPIGTVRRVYEEFLAVLERKNLISTDDMHNFTEIYPLFEPFYVSYDKNEEYVDIAPLAARLLHVKERERRGAQLQMVNQFMGRSLTPAEVNYIGHMTTMIEAGDGRIEDGMFVSVPSVCLLAVSGLVDNAFGLGTKLEADANVMHASFLLAGLSVESSLELIAHGEAAVARLTTSKTNAMNVPMFRVQGAGSGDAKQYLRRVQMLRRGFESEADPKQAWGAAGVELWNATNSGAKATALVYTMTLADFGKVFIGRMGESGNELEVSYRWFHSGFTPSFL